MNIEMQKIATSIMGWVASDNVWEMPDGDTVMLVDSWNPLERWDHLGMLIEKLRKLNYHIVMECSFFDEPWCVLESLNVIHGKQMDILGEGDTFKEAVCKAVLGLIDESN